MGRDFHSDTHQTYMLKFTGGRHQTTIWAGTSALLPPEQFDYFKPGWWSHRRPSSPNADYWQTWSPNQTLSATHSRDREHSIFKLKPGCPLVGRMQIPTSAKYRLDPVKWHQGTLAGQLQPPREFFSRLRPGVSLPSQAGPRRRELGSSHSACSTSTVPLQTRSRGIKVTALGLG